MAYLLAFALMFALPFASADSYVTDGSPQTVDGAAAIGEGTGASPEVKYVWILPDDQPDVGTDTQLEIIPSGERDWIWACVVVADADNRDTIEDVFIDLYHPDDSFKYQSHGYILADWDEGTDRWMPQQDRIIRHCLDPASRANLITSGERAEIEYNTFDQPYWHVYKVFLPMYYHQPCGEYDAWAYTVDSTSRISTPLVEPFDWVCGTYLELDFDTVNFGTIQPGAWKWAPGDTDMQTPDKPTLKNEGNTEIYVGLEFSEFVGQDSLPNKVIRKFDAQLRNLGTNNYKSIPGEHLEFLADQFVEFTYPISLCRQEKIDFSIHADVGTVPDNYAGDITVFARPNIVDVPVPEMDYPVDFDLEHPPFGDPDIPNEVDI